MKKRKKKSRIRIDRLILVVLTFVLLVSITILIFIQIFNLFKNPFEDLGYNKKAALIFKKLDDNYQKEILGSEYNFNLEKIVLDQKFNLEDYPKYKKIIEENVDFDQQLMFESVEQNIDYKRYLVLKNNIFTRDKYYIMDNYDRYLSYYEANYNYENATIIRDVVETVNCNADYSPYSKTNPADTSLKQLMLINKYYYLQDNYQPDNLEKIDENFAFNGYLSAVAKKSFEKMANDAKKEGYYLYANSSYRDFNEQLNLFSEYRLASGDIAADTFSARAGFSEHQSGYVVDIISNAPDSILESFEFTKEYKWMQDNAYKYGFIQHYKKGKEKYTGYMAESWHYRYVGEEVAKYLQNNDITFDEYYEFYIKKR